MNAAQSHVLPDEEDRRSAGRELGVASRPPELGLLFERFCFFIQKLRTGQRCG